MLCAFLREISRQWKNEKRSLCMMIDCILVPLKVLVLPLVIFPQNYTVVKIAKQNIGPLFVSLLNAYQPFLFQLSFKTLWGGLEMTSWKSVLGRALGGYLERASWKAIMRAQWACIRTWENPRFWLWWRQMIISYPNRTARWVLFHFWSYKKISWCLKKNYFLPIFKKNPYFT